MADINPGPAITSNANSLAVMTPVNAQSSSSPQGANGYRLLAVAYGVALGATGDPVALSILNSSSYVPALVVTCNGQLAGVGGSVATASVGIYSAPAAGGTAILTSAVLTGQTSQAFAYIRAATDVTLAVAFQTLYVHVATALATATTDLFLYGYDLSAPGGV